MKNVAILSLILVLLAAGYFSRGYFSSEGDDKVVNVYSSRKEELLSAIFAEFTRTTGVKVNYINDDAAQLIARMESDESNKVADVFLTSDVVNLVVAKNKGLLSKVQSPLLDKAIPAKFRDSEGYWFGFTKRVRLMVYRKDVVKPSDLSTYEDLVNPKWKGKILLRSSSSPYNQSLIAFIIANDGEEEARSWVKGVVSNMARKPSGGDTDQIYAVAAGEGDVAVVNSYYFARILASEHPKDVKAAESVAVFFPNQNSYGSMINISGGAVTAQTKNRDNAVSLLEFLSSEKAQKLYAEVNQEYPIVSGVEMSKTLKSWGEYKESELPMQQLEQHLHQAVRIADEEGWR